MIGVGSVIVASLVIGVVGVMTFALVRQARYRAQIAARLIAQPSQAVVVTLEEIARPASAGALIGLAFPQERMPVWIRWLGVPLRRAGFKLGSIDMLLFMTLGGLVLGGLVQVLAQKMHWTIAASVFGVYAPYALASFLAGRRILRGERQLGDVLDVMVGALEAGVGIRQSLEIVRSEMRDPISTEFGEVLARMDLGTAPPEAFREMGRALRSKYFDLFVTTLAAKWDVGGNLSDMLRGLARRIRESVRLVRRVRSLTAEARFSASILFMMPYALAAFMWVNNPEALIYLYNHPLGRSLIEWAIGLQILAL
ncbi:MAG TPA: type II secretion system F family protein, partial [Planctomycetota bacterium]|nr:type II secretion system F family protein [Planctomycetota bacterium]